ncbi:hypothetical protein D0X99_02025 [Algoriphagus lacus]|uniref:Uncharacterized protein n=1 Tax=Algoriphagus lacus TaxID=2056311 RepID=A0A418PWD2_9BACT|nr:hypothetical protein D0X99_02025 [Algoriphagus lacus]
MSIMIHSKQGVFETLLLDIFFDRLQEKYSWSLRNCLCFKNPLGLKILFALLYPPKIELLFCNFNHTDS